MPTTREQYEMLLRKLPGARDRQAARLIREHMGQLWHALPQADQDAMLRLADDLERRRTEVTT
jgi:hypothetical protein